MKDDDLLAQAHDRLHDVLDEQVMNDPYVMEVYLGTKKEGASA